ncbi:MAG: NBR1-Ig-like domain-containing protein [Anaerolineales bacterium]
MNIKKYSPALFLIFSFLIQMACSIPSGAATPDTFATLNGLYTASAQTQQAGGAQTGLTATPGLPVPTSTGIGGIATATNTPILSSPVPVSRCDAAAFLADVTYPDGSLVARKNTFVKIWRIQNVGTCSWTTSYALVFYGGDGMNGPAATALTKTVNPGEYIDIPVTLTSPNTDGHYRGYWKLRNASGALFGIGSEADTAFWVDINVGGPSYISYDFAVSYCDANWENNDGALPCPGTNGDAKGYAIKLNAPVMENGATEDEPGLLTVPKDAYNGVITGQYPSYTVQAGDHFRTLINCQYNSNKCDVIFRLDYKNNGKVKTLASWHEVYEGQYYPVDLDLSSLAGESVKFILVVTSNGGQKNDNALWLHPHILRQGTMPTSTSTIPPSTTPTATFTSTPTFTPSATSTPTETPTPTSTPTP